MLVILLLLFFLDSNGVSTSPTGDTSTGREVVAMWNYTAQYSDELTFSKGEIIQILKEGKR